MSGTTGNDKQDGRLDGPEWGLLLDRTKSVSFTFDGAAVAGYQGDVVASALYAAGRTLLSRSFKYHRPRGVLTMAGHDVNTFVQDGSEPNVRADRHPISAASAITSINRVGSLDRDWLAALGYFSRFLPVGFYYKTFFRPRGAWKLFEPVIRHLAGLGRLDVNAAHGHYDKAYLFADVLVVGGGPAGLEAALAAAETGAETLLVDEWPQLGGSLMFGRCRGTRDAVVTYREDLVRRAMAHPSLKIMTDTTVSGLFADNWASAIRDHRLYKIRAREIVLATGAFDQPIVFPNNDRPGIMFADAAQRLMRLYAVKPGARAVIATSNRFGYETALDLLDAGIAVEAVVDLRDPADGGEAAAELRRRGMRIITGVTPINTKGKRRIEQVAIGRIVGEGRVAGEPEWLDADLLVMSAGYAPAVNLASHAGAKVIYDGEIAMHRTIDLPSGISTTGSAAGLWAEDAVAADAKRTGLRAAQTALALAATASDAPLVDASARTITHPFPIFPGDKAFIDFDEDLTVDDIVNTIADGYDDIQLVKRYSTAGIGPSQGRHSNVNTIRIVASVTGKSAASVGTTTFRPPLVPEKFAHMAGRSFEPVRLTPMHHRHVEAHASMMVAGAWLRPQHYASAASSADSIAEEISAVRNRAGLIDISTLGGLDVRGADAAQFLDRMYTMSYTRQPVGRARYALMCDETGVVIDDGVAARFHDGHFYVTATTGAAGQVYRAMTRANVDWQLDVDITNVTAAYAAVNLAGPAARDVLSTLGSDIDFSKDAFPYMAARRGHIGGCPVRVMRVGFVGELGYEIHCPSGMGEALWDMLMAAGQPFSIMPFGVEAQRVLRLEKAHIIVGQDTDGLTNPLEAGMAWALPKKAGTYIGKRAIEMQAAKGIQRNLVGFTLVEQTAESPKECHLVIEGGKIIGRVTSAVRSPTLGKVIGLAYVPPDRTTPGSLFEIRVDDGTTLDAIVVETPFYDPKNSRQEA